MAKRQRNEKEIEVQPLSSEAADLLARCFDLWDEMELPKPPEREGRPVAAVGENLDVFIKHYDIKFRSFIVEDDDELGKKYTATIAYVGDKAYFIWGPWNGPVDDENSFYWESCDHCVMLLGMYDSFKRKRPRY